MIINKGDWNVANGYSFAFYNGGVGDVLMCEIGKVWARALHILLPTFPQNGGITWFAWLTVLAIVFM
jgi:hypothetical protein